MPGMSAIRTVSDDRMRWPPRTRPTIPMMAAITATRGTDEEQCDEERVVALAPVQGGRDAVDEADVHERDRADREQDADDGGHDRAAGRVST